MSDAIPMRVLTVKQPWAWAIIHGGKNIENRVRNLAGSYRGPVAIHAGKTWDASSNDNPQEWEIRRAITSLDSGWPASDSEVWAAETVEPDDPRFVRSAIIGVVDLTDVHTADDSPQTVGRPGLWPTCSIWAERVGWHLVLDNPRALSEAVPWVGSLGLRTLPTTVSARILTMVTAAAQPRL